MSFIDADVLKKSIRHNLLHFNSDWTVDDCNAIDSIIDSQTEIKPFDRDNGAEPLLETRNSLIHVSYSNGKGGFESREFTDWTCPQCGWFVGELYSGCGRWHIQGNLSYCAKCGQKIDWTLPKEEEKHRYEERKAKEREESLKNRGMKLDNMHERRRIKYGITSEDDV